MCPRLSSTRWSAKVWRIGDVSEALRARLCGQGFRGDVTSVFLLTSNKSKVFALSVVTLGP